MVCPVCLPLAALCRQLVNGGRPWEETELGSFAGNPAKGWYRVSEGADGGHWCSASVEVLVLAAAHPTVPHESGFGIDSHQLCSSQAFP